MTHIGAYSDNDNGKLYMAGHLTPSGLYEEIETHRKIVLERDGYLPARMDGHIACYVRLEAPPYPIGERERESRS